MFKKLIWVFLCTLTHTISCTFSTSNLYGEELVTHNEESIDCLLKIMARRLVLMHEVAKYKWNRQIPIEDLPREQELLQYFSIQAAQRGIDPDRWTRFLQSQINAAKIVQYRDWMQWKEMEITQFSDVLDLETELRPQLDLVTRELLEAFCEVASFIIDEQWLKCRARIFLIGNKVDDIVRVVALNVWLEPTSI